MSPSLRPISLAFYAVAFFGTVPVCNAFPVTGHSLARSRNEPSPPFNATHGTSYFSALQEARNSPIHTISPYSESSSTRLPVSRVMPRRHVFRQLPSGELAELNKSYQKAKKESKALRELRDQAVTADPNDEVFKKRFATAAQGYTSNILDFKIVLEKLTAEKGLAFYDPSDPIEGLVKKIVNLHKDTLSELVKIVESFPFLGPVLGPILYNVKCIVDEVLNILENVTDATLNLLKPIVDPLLGSVL